MNFRGRQKAEAPTFQIAPMIDVIFLLLCFFIASQIFSQWETEIGIVLPTSTSGDPPDRLPGEIIINIRTDGSVVINNNSLRDEDLSNLLRGSRDFLKDSRFSFVQTGSRRMSTLFACWTFAVRLILAIYPLLLSRPRKGRNLEVFGQAGKEELFAL